MRAIRLTSTDQFHSLPVLCGILLAIVLTLFTGTALAQPASERNTAAIQVTFKNFTVNKVDAYWIDFDGKEQLMHSLLPGDSHSRQSGIRHTWVFKAGDKRVATFRANTSPTQQFEILNEGTGKATASKRNTGYVDFTMVNPSRQTLTYFWTDFDGNLIRIGTIEGEKKIERQTGEGHWWVTRDRYGKMMIPCLAQANQENKCVIRHFRPLPLQGGTIHNNSNQDITWKCLIPGRDVGSGGQVQSRQTSSVGIIMISQNSPSKVVVTNGTTLIGVFTPVLQGNDGWTVVIP